MHFIKELIRKVIPSSLVSRLEKMYRKGRGLFWQARFGFPASGMKVIAVTGTNGKTTTAGYINEVLKAGGYKTALLTTVYFEIDGEKTRNDTHFTIVKQSLVQSFFARAKKQNVDWVVLEVTSHALDQERIMGVPVEIAVVTNLTQEHLDYHKTMQGYAHAKSRLLSEYGAKYAVLNADDQWFEFFKSSTDAEVVTYGKKRGSNTHIASVKISESETSATISSGKEKLKISTSLLGEFNIQNAAAAVSVGKIIGVEKSEIIDGIKALKGIDGRMERVVAGQDFLVLVDFAITPGAIQQALESLKNITKSKGKVRIVFGATGDRDKAKRSLMGEVAAKNADYIYLTDDETYKEDPKTIRDSVYEGIKKAKGEKKTHVIPDRKKAIKQAIQDAKKHDIVLLTGIGHEDSRNMGGKLIPWSEKEVATKIIKSS